MATERPIRLPAPPQKKNPRVRFFLPRLQFARIIHLLFAPRWISRKASGGVIFFPECVHAN
jgi:hypothetical protein